MSVTIPLATASGELHGLINTLTNSVPFDDFKNFEPKHKEQLKKEKKDDDRIVKVEYINSRGRHERLTKPYCKYAGDPIKIFHLIPGHIYEVPYGMVKEVNAAEKGMPRRSGLVSVDGENVTLSGAPTDKDDYNIQPLHRLIPAGF